jgi:outer membrane protein OmpA-like peptidoglycan-associated protein
MKLLNNVVLIFFFLFIIGCSSSKTADLKVSEYKYPNSDRLGIINGKITNISGNPIDADMKITDLNSHETLANISSNPRDGAFLLALPLGKNFGVFIDKKGYFPTSINIDLENYKNEINLREDIVLFTIDDLKNKDIPIRINNIFFETNKAALLPESFPELNRLANILQGIPGIKVEIAGHTDNTGRADYNLELSRKRAQSVVDYLISKGCEKFSLTAKGYGAKKPIVPNDSDENKSKNRRVEFRIIK